METLLGRLGTAAARHPWRTISGWLVAVTALIGLADAGGGAFADDFTAPGTESQRAADVITAHFPNAGTASADVVLHVDSGSLRDPARAAAVRAVLTDVVGQPDVARASDPYAPGGTITADGRTAIVTVQYTREVGALGPAAYHRLNAAADRARGAGVTVEARGLVVDVANMPTTSTAELVGLGAALVVLLLAFGSVVAAGLPVVVALIGLAAGSALVLLAGTVLDIPTSAPIVAVMLGLGAGIDYALFVVSRFRRQLAAGNDPVTAAGRATASAGHAVVFAGGTVVVAILGLWFAGIPFVSTMGVAGALTVAPMVVAALTLLPALLGLLGKRVDALRVWRRPARPGRSGWQRWGNHVHRHRWLYTVGTVAVLLLLAAPVLSLRLGMPDDGTQPVSFTQRRAYDLITERFGGGYNGPLLVVVELPAADPDAAAALPRLAAALTADKDVVAVTPAVPSENGRAALLTVVPRGAPQDAATSTLVHRIRDTVVPEALAGTGARASVGGSNALLIDMADVIAARLPWVVAAVIGASCLLLFVMLRAVVLAIKAALVTLLSIGAAYGVVVAVFQWGWALDVIGVDKPVPIMSVVPLFLFAVLFGLSMDYEVFLLTSVREEYLSAAVSTTDRAAGDADVRASVAGGLAATGRVITSAATIMALVFASFVAIQDTLVKVIGVGLAAAVIVDATVIRVVLVPAIMGILGQTAWWPVRLAPAPRPATRERAPSPR